MKKVYLKTFNLAIIMIVCLAIVPLSQTQSQTPDYTASFLLLNRTDGDLTYELNVTIPQNLYQYYAFQSHIIFSPADFAKFVTPSALKPIADRLWQLYNNTEDFTNAVLSIVHQINYTEVIPGRYPIETLAIGRGDCDLFAYIAASILEAGGIPVVLIYYKAQEHMELGVDLGYVPTQARVDVFSVNVENVSYYIAECTGSQWRDGWRVGETPSEYQNATSQVVTLETMEQFSIGQVSASLRELELSNIHLSTSSTLMLGINNLTFNGQILPYASNQNVTLQAKINGGSWTTIGIVETQSNGSFTYNWVPPADGSIVVQAKWLGNRQYNGAISSSVSMLILPLFFVIAIVVAVSFLFVFVVIFFRLRRKKTKLLAQEMPLMET